MRSCGACFFGVGFRYGVDEGDCFFDPPKVHIREVLDEGDGAATAQTFSCRPRVGRQDFCGHFSHRNEKPHTP